MVRLNFKVYEKKFAFIWLWDSMSFITFLSNISKNKLVVEVIRKT